MKRKRQPDASAGPSNAGATDDKQRALSFSLPHFSRYSKYQVSSLPDSDPRFRIIENQFVKSVLAHRGPQKGDPHREPPKFEVKKIERISNPGLQEKYLVGLQDEIGLCDSGRVQPVKLDALAVQSFEGTHMNEFLLFHGTKADKIEGMCRQGLDRFSQESN